MSIISDMPIFGASRTDLETADLETARVRAIEQPIRNELDNVTRLLCEVMSKAKYALVPDGTFSVTPSKELINWWEARKKADRARAEKDAKEKQIWALERQIERLKKEIV